GAALGTRRARSDAGLDQHAVRRVVGEPQVDARPGHRRLATDGVAVDVEGVWLVLDVLQPGEEGGVEGGGRRLRDAPAVVLLEDAVLDDEALDEAVLGGALADR